MNRVSFIREHGDLGNSDDTRALFNAFVQCLSPTEACAALDLSFQQEIPRRRTILRKILRDCEDGFEECHFELLHDLIEAVELLPSPKRQSCGHTLSALYDVLPSELQVHLMLFFLSSQSLRYRRRGYKKLQQNWDEGYADVLDKIWTKYYDTECAGLLIHHFPLEYLESHFEELEHEIYGTWHHRKLYLRIGADNPALLNRLAQQDEITFIYILVKLKYRLAEEKILAIYERNKYDDRLGLLLWCIGQMGHWSVLEKVSKEIDKIPAERFRLWYREYASQPVPC